MNFSKQLTKGNYLIRICHSRKILCSKKWHETAKNSHPGENYPPVNYELVFIHVRFSQYVIRFYPPYCSHAVTTVAKFFSFHCPQLYILVKGGRGVRCFMGVTIFLWYSTNKMQIHMPYHLNSMCAYFQPFLVCELIQFKGV